MSTELSGLGPPGGRGRVPDIEVGANSIDKDDPQSIDKSFIMSRIEKVAEMNGE